MALSISNLETLLPRKTFYMGEWWFPKIDIYLFAHPQSKDPKQMVKYLMRSFRKEGIDIPTQYLAIRAYDGQVEPYACTNKNGAQIILGRLQASKVKQLIWHSNGAFIFTSWKKRIEEAVAQGKCRCELRDGEKWYAVSDMIGIIRTYYGPQTPPSMAGYIAKQNGKSKTYNPWDGRHLYFHDRSPIERYGFTYAVRESRLPEFFQALYEMREVHRKERKIKALTNPPFSA